MKKYIVPILLIMIFYSCDKDLLDKRPMDKFSESDVWTDFQLSRAFVNNIYNDVLGIYYSQVTDDWTDNVMLSEFGLVANTFPGAGNLAPTIKQGLVTRQTNVGWNRFGMIRKCNLAIEKLTGNEHILPAQRDIMIAEAKMLRAMIYHNLVMRFGGVIIVDRVLTPDDEFQLSRSSETEVVNFIIRDLEDAAQVLPAQVAHGRLSKYAAYAFLARVALGAGLYEKVIQYCNIVEEGGFVLDDYYNISKDYSSIINSPEVILSFARERTHNIFGQTHHQRFLPGMGNDRLGPGVGPPTIPQGFGGWLQCYPPQELVDAYLFIDGDNVVQRKGEEFIGMPADLMWENRDERFELSIVRDGSYFFNQFVAIRKMGNLYWGAWPAAPSQQSASGYYFRKFLYEDHAQGYPQPMSYALPLLRLGEVYLNKAEAYYRLDDLDKAIEYTNKTRTTHGGLPPIDNSVSPEAFFELYKIERRVELLYENDRYWSLRRWALKESATTIPELNGSLHSLIISEDGIVEDIVPAWHKPGERRFEAKNFYFPIPDSEVLNNPNLTQNPLW